MYESFTSEAIKVIEYSQEESRRTHHKFVGTEQILLGLIRQKTGIAALSLASFGINLNDTRNEVEKIILQGPGSPDDIPLTPRAQRLIEYSRIESKNLGHACINTEHLLLGMLMEGVGVGSQVLANLGVDATFLRNKTLENISQASSD